MTAVVITDLREVPQFADIIAHRAWNAWWTDSDMSQADYRAGLDQMIHNSGIPFALVAHEGGAYRGSVLVIDNDLDARPQYKPWIAALWVEPDARRLGIAGSLIDAARQVAEGLGHPCCNLCATPENSPYYLARGFRLVESDVEGLNVFVI